MGHTHPQPPNFSGGRSSQYKWHLDLTVHLYVIHKTSLTNNLSNKYKAQLVWDSLRSWQDLWAGEQQQSRHITSRLFTNPLTASPLAFMALLQKQKHSCAKSHQLHRLVWNDNHLPHNDSSYMSGLANIDHLLSLSDPVWIMLRKHHIRKQLH